MQTYAWDEPQGTGACADGAPIAPTRPFFPICNVNVQVDMDSAPRIMINPYFPRREIRMAGP